jgi:hypothetical protein
MPYIQARIDNTSSDYLHATHPKAKRTVDRRHKVRIGLDQLAVLPHAWHASVRFLLHTPMSNAVLLPRDGC